MIIPAFYENQKVFLNTNYIVDIWDIDKPFVSAYVLDSERQGYRIEQKDFQKWIELENNPQETIICKEQREDSFKQNMNFIKAFKEIKALEGGISSYYNDRPWVFKDEVIAIIEKYTGDTEYGTDSN